MARTTNKAESLLTFSRASSGTALTKVAYGPQLVTNGGFDTASDWTLTGNATISGGAVSWTTNSAVTQTSPSIVSVGKIYLVSFDVTSYTSGYVYPYIGGKIQDTNQRGNVVGSYEFYVVVTEVLSQQIGIYSGNSPTHTVDNISIKEVFFNDPTGTLKLISHPTNKPRVEYDANGVAKGLLIEEQRTNFLLQSATFSDWSVSSSTAALSYSGTTLDGSTQAIKLQDNNTSGVGNVYIVKTLNITTSTDYTFSIFAKKDQLDWVSLSAFGFTSVNSSAWFDLSSGTLGDIGLGLTAKIESFPSGWYRCSISFVTDVTDSNGSLYINVVESNATYDANKDGTSSILIFGAQLETGSFPTSYIPTSGATATRSADLASVSVSEFGYNDAQGTFVVEFQTPDFINANIVDLGITSNDRFLIRNGLAFYRTTAGLAQVTINYGSSANNQRVAFAVQTNDAAAAVNGTIVGTDTTVTLFSDPTTLEIGALVNNSTVEKLNGHIKSIKYYPVRLDDDKLKELTL